MRQKLNYILTISLFLTIFSCKNERTNNSPILNLKTELRTDSTAIYSAGTSEIVNIEQPEKTIFLDLEIDTTKLFGTWIQDPTAPFADFHVTKESFNIVDFDGEGEMPYILEKNEIIVFYRNVGHKGIITSTKNDTLKIRWSDNEKEIGYVKIEN